MFELFKKLFRNSSTDDYPETLIKAAIEHAVDNTDPWIRAVSGYKRKLRPAVLQSMKHVGALVDEMPPVIVVISGSYINNSRLRPFFISSSDMWKVLHNCMNSTDFRRAQGATMPWVYALLTMQKNERSVSGAEVVGDIVLRDVLRDAVSFESHQLIDPSESEDETRGKLKKRAFDHLLSLALSRITTVKLERKRLERYRALLQSKLNMLQRSRRGFQAVAAEGQTDFDEVERLIGNFDEELMQLGGDDRMLETYLDIVTDVLGRADEHLWVKKERLIIDRMGIRHNEPADGTQKVILDLVCDSEELSLVCMPVAIFWETIESSDNS